MLTVHSLSGVLHSNRCFKIKTKEFIKLKIHKTEEKEKELKFILQINKKLKNRTENFFLIAGDESAWWSQISAYWL